MKPQIIGILLLVPGLTAQQSGPTKDQVANQQSNSAQHTKGAQQSSSETDRGFQNTLNSDAHILDRLVGFGVGREWAEAFVHSQPEGDLKIQWHSIKSDSEGPNAVMFLPCGFDGASIFALKEGDEGWKVTDWESFDCHYDENVTPEFQEIRFPNRDEILVHHACVGHGTGYLQQDIQVFLPIQGKLKLEMDAQEVLNSFPPTGMGPDLAQRSTFTVIPIRNSRSRAIEETRSSHSGDRLTVQRRLFRWNNAKKKYVPSAFTPVEASSE